MCFVSVCCVGFAHFGCLPDETCSNGSPVFAGYFLPPIWKKMGSEDRWQRTLIDRCYLSSDLTEWRVFGLLLGKLPSIHFMYLSDCNWIPLVFLVHWALPPKVDTQSILRWVNMKSNRVCDFHSNSTNNGSNKRSTMSSPNNHLEHPLPTHRGTAHSSPVGIRLSPSAMSQHCCPLNCNRPGVWWSDHKHYEVYL